MVVVTFVGGKVDLSEELLLMMLEFSDHSDFSSLGSIPGGGCLKS